MRAIWTGFEPFGEHVYNPSWDVARAADRYAADELDSTARELPVEFGAVERWARRLVECPVPDLIVQFGLGESRSRICLESAANNARSPRPDEAGEERERPGPLVAEGPQSFETTASVDSLHDELARRLAEVDLPEVRISDDAGAFVCNALYFSTLRRVHELGGGERSLPTVLFVHVPALAPERAERLGRIFADVAGELRPE